jgi:hypothetical protein
MKNNDKIRERVSYKRFEKIYNTLEGNNKAQIMKIIIMNIKLLHLLIIYFLL